MVFSVMWVTKVWFSNTIQKHNQLVISIVVLVEVSKLSRDVVSHENISVVVNLINPPVKLIIDILKVSQLIIVTKRTKTVHEGTEFSKILIELFEKKSINGKTMFYHNSIFKDVHQVVEYPYIVSINLAYCQMVEALIYDVFHQSSEFNTLIQLI